MATKIIKVIHQDGGAHYYKNERNREIELIAAHPNVGVRFIESMDETGIYFTVFGDYLDDGHVRLKAIAPNQPAA